MDKTKRFLDPIIAVRERRRPNAATYWTPNGYHRLTALKELGAKTMLALLVPERAVAYQILALNIEKAHNLREKAIGVRRMYARSGRDRRRQGRGLRARIRRAGAGDAGLRLRGAGTAFGRRLPFHPAQGRRWLPGACGRAGRARRRGAAPAARARRCGRQAVVAGLKQRGFTSPYLRTSSWPASTRCASSRAIASLHELLAAMTKRARGMNLDKIRAEDIARTGGGPMDEGE